MGIGRIKKGFATLVSGMALALVLSSFVAPTFTAFADEMQVEENVAIIGTSTGLVEGVQVNDYSVSIEVGSDATINVVESLSVEFVQEGVDEFYRNIPRPITELSAVMVSCEGNTELEYSITASENETTIACFGGTEKGNAWTYELVYSFNTESSLGREWLFTIVGESETMSADISLPVALTDYETYSNAEISTKLSLDGKRISVCAEDETVAVNEISVKITLPNQQLVDDAKDVLETTFVSVWLPMLPSVLLVAVIIACFILMVAI